MLVSQIISFFLLTNMSGCICSYRRCSPPIRRSVWRVIRQWWSRTRSSRSSCLIFTPRMPKYQPSLSLHPRGEFEKYEQCDFIQRKAAFLLFSSVVKTILGFRFCNKCVSRNTKRSYRLLKTLPAPSLSGMRCCRTTSKATGKRLLLSEREARRWPPPHRSMSRPSTLWMRILELPKRNLLWLRFGCVLEIFPSFFYLFSLHLINT